MNTRTSVTWSALSMFVIGLTTPAWAVDLDAMKKKAETAKGHVENVKKEGGEVKQSAKEMKTQETMKNAGEMKDEGKKLKDVVTGK